ncbi:hypothetical protein SAMN05421734_102398 [Pelagirhabdus alkalitolerans]|uniref:Uncharacterized protein n=1 Tax=Pelagirhabdus alkalitolerans TaxID=1612202 RepID=A0A1G6HC49_9BACI|nr:hypothetical protein [Pelagirhabdus alkalitolerans]SDB91016.1 hypothetical protein SAMN05421734_102398 [Pelagirhabdus alkalitolerans]
MNKKHIIILAIVYSSVTFILHNVFETTIGAILMTISFFGLVFGILTTLFVFFRFSFKVMRFDKQKNRQVSE